VQCCAQKCAILVRFHSHAEMSKPDSKIQRMRRVANYLFCRAKSRVESKSVSLSLCKRQKRYPSPFGCVKIWHSLRFFCRKLCSVQTACCLLQNFLFFLFYFFFLVRFKYMAKSFWQRRNANCIQF